MKRKVQMTLTQDEYVHLVALKNYFGFKSLSETVSFAVQKEIASRQESSTYAYRNFYEDKTEANKDKLFDAVQMIPIIIM